MLMEYALSPDIFDASCYSNSEIFRPLFKNLIDPLLQEGIVRNLWDGEWIHYVNDDSFSLHPVAKYFLEELKKQNRLRFFPAISKEEPKNYREWCEEAFGSHVKDALNGIIVTEEIKKDRKFKKISKIGSIETIYLCNWWKQRSASLRVHRNIDDYLIKLKLILQQASHLMFIDPNIDPEKGNYQDFYKLLLATKRTDIPPRIEIHRKCARGSGKQAQILTKQWENIFRDNWEEQFYNEGLQAEVFIWDEFHDRYLITNIIGINLPYGFDTDPRPNARTTWCRLGREDRDDIQKEFDHAAKRHKLQHRFYIVE